MIDRENLSLKLTINHKYGSVKSGLAIISQDTCYLGMGFKDEKGKWKGHLVELNLKTLKLERSLKTQDMVS